MPSISIFAPTAGTKITVREMNGGIVGQGHYISYQENADGTTVYSTSEGAIVVEGEHRVDCNDGANDKRYVMRPVYSPSFEISVAAKDASDARKVLDQTIEYQKLRRKYAAEDFYVDEPVKQKDGLFLVKVTVNVRTTPNSY